MIFLLLVFFCFRSLNKKAYKLDASRITVKKGEEGDFRDIILIDGDIEPINMAVINTLEGSTVDEIFIKDGVWVEKGTPFCSDRL